MPCGRRRESAQTDASLKLLHDSCGKACNLFAGLPFLLVKSVSFARSERNRRKNKNDSKTALTYEYIEVG